jgi:NADPH:quinone reductase-like Zn-dependent oxidoreductase
MKAVTIQSYGGPEVLALTDRQTPTATRGKVLVRVRTVSINPRDWLVREGAYVFNFALPKPPFVPGSDFAGEVTSIGPGVRNLRIGDRVFGMQPLLGSMGAHAQYVAIDASAVALMPSDSSFEECAAVPCAGLTAWGALVKIGRIQPGQRVLINGASGGVGTYAVQIAVALGAHVIGVSSGANEDLVRSLGAREFINYKSVQPEKVAEKIDIFLDAVGRSSFQKAVHCLGDGGRYVTTIPNGRSVLQTLKTSLSRPLGVNQSRSAHLVLVRASGSDLQRIASLMAAGKVRSVIDEVFPISQIAAAHVKSRTWRVRGKLVLTVE